MASALLDALESEPATFSAENLSGLRACLERHRKKVTTEVLEVLDRTPKQDFVKEEEERLLDLTLSTVKGSRFVGQVVEERGELRYASIVARHRHLFSAS